MLARIASQPYPPIAQRTRAWVAGLGNEPEIGELNAFEGSSTTPQENANSVLAGRLDEGSYSEQSALAEALSFPEYNVPVQDIEMENPWESATVASTMHTASMYDWNDGASEATMQSSKTGIRGWSPPDDKEEGGCHDKDSVYAPSSRSVTPPRRVSPRKGKKRAKRRAVLDEDYDEENMGPAISGALVVQDTLAHEQESYLPSSTAVESKNRSFLFMNFPIVTLYSR